MKGTDGLLNVQKKTEMQRPWALHFAARSAWLAFLGGKRSRGHYHDDIINPIILNSDEGNTPCQFLHHISSSIIFPLAQKSSISIGESQAEVLAAANSSSPRESDRHRRSSWTFVQSVLVAAGYKMAMDHALACASCQEVGAALGSLALLSLVPFLGNLRVDPLFS